MKKINLNKMRHELPYKLPKEDFFESFSKELFSKIEAENISPISISEKSGKRKSIRRRDYLTPSYVGGLVAAVAIVFVAIFVHHENSVNSKGEFAINDEIVEGIDIYLSKLSDEEFSKLYAESSPQLDFYMNLPNI